MGDYLPPRFAKPSFYNFIERYYDKNGDTVNLSRLDYELKYGSLYKRVNYRNRRVISTFIVIGRDSSGVIWGVTNDEAYVSNIEGSKSVAEMRGS